ncbi:MAG TPA: VanZ family protein [Rhizomicrobium sp.]|nr:VanZ family protein [Rhizomicrobium sp.]
MPPSDPAPRSVPRHALAVAVAALIAYGSLYPFVFHHAGPFSADIANFLASAHRPPQGRGDVLANVLLYIPLGLAATLAFVQDMRRVLAAALTFLCGVTLSLFVELAQFYDADRVSAFSDFYLNVAGLVAGILIALMIGTRFARASWPGGSMPAFARLLLLAWLGWRLYPYAPTLEIHHYWRSLQPVLLAPVLVPINLFRFTVLWLSVGVVLRTGLGRSTGFFPLVALCYFAAKASIIGQSIALADLLGAVLAIGLTPLLLGRFKSVGFPVTAAAMIAVVVLSRILPWQFAAVPRSFQWIPFFSFLHGSQQIDAISFAEKFYLYGVTILLLVKAGLSLRLAVALECLLLFATSYLQIYMVGRSAEISDAILALILGLIYGYMRHQYREDAEASSQSLPQAAELNS